MNNDVFATKFLHFYDFHLQLLRITAVCSERSKKNFSVYLYVSYYTITRHCKEMSGKNSCGGNIFAVVHIPNYYFLRIHSNKLAPVYVFPARCIHRKCSLLLRHFKCITFPAFRPHYMKLTRAETAIFTLISHLGRFRWPRARLNTEQILCHAACFLVRCIRATGTEPQINRVYYSVRILKRLCAGHS